jgi:hypothetical protein
LKAIIDDRKAMDASPISDSELKEMLCDVQIKKIEAHGGVPIPDLMQELDDKTIRNYRETLDSILEEGDEAGTSPDVVVASPPVQHEAAQFI